MSAAPRAATALADTIAALATPAGTGGLAVLRLSGRDAIAVAARVFAGRADLELAATHSAHAGAVTAADGALIDTVVATVFRAPHSYTGEDSVEFGCHGGVAVTRALLARLYDAGARPAEPGEFTRRAFLNGKMDLAQAEAVADLIHAQSDAACRASARQLEGRLSVWVLELRERLLRCASLLELALDFPDDDEVPPAPADLARELADARAAVAAALDSFAGGRVLRDGLTVVLAGAPNTGKSSMLNALLGARRAIVTDMPGTTRDYIEESALLEGRLVRLVDTAGLRAPADEAEREGLRFSEDRIAGADVVCLLAEAGAPAGAVRAEAARMRARMAADAELLVLRTKCDLERPAGAVEGAIATSARTGEGVAELAHRLAQCADARTRAGEAAPVLVTNARHAACLRAAGEALDAARRALADRRGEDLLALDVRRAIAALGDIIGAVSGDDVLDAVFSRFCIGK